MRKINIKTSGANYDIILGNRILEHLNPYLEKYDKILILSNDRVGKLYFEDIKKLLIKENIYFFELPDGEENKNIDSIYKVYDFMIENDFTRSSAIVSLGGGVICDMGGFVGATYMRGIDFIQIPTSLLAQVDASIGGKTAIDHKKGKNLIGAFKQPKLVLIDIDFLLTLEDKEFSSGMGEVIKYSLIIYSRDREFYEFLNKNSEKLSKFYLEKNMTDEIKEILEDLIYKSCMIKKYYVENDELEKGERALLNLGHTYAHTLETLFHFKNITHGEAVSKGIIFEMSLSNVEKTFIDTTIKLFEKYKINPYPVFFEKEILLKTLAKDKKNSFGNINFILFDENLKIYKSKVSEEKIIESIDKFKNRFIKGIIDIGTNSCRLFLAQVYIESGNIKIEKELLKDVKIVKLGEDLTKNHFILEKAIKRTIEQLKIYKKIANSYGSFTLSAFATSATRDAENGSDFLEEVKKLGIDIRCISGETEAKYNFYGNSLVFEEKILVLDIGGGSTEFSLGQGKNIEFIKSLNIGAVRAKELFFKNEDYSNKNMENMVEWVYNNLRVLDISKPYKLVGVAGTLTTQVSVLEKMLKYDREIVHKYEISLDKIKSNLELFLSCDLEKRKNIIGLEEKRADVIIPGTLILIAVMEFLKVDTIVVSESDNLNGAMVSYE